MFDAQAVVFLVHGNEHGRGERPAPVCRDHVTTGVGCRVLPVTCGRDGREHLVADEAMDAGYAGRYVALCGYDLLAVALAFPPGPRCSGCVAVREGRTGGRGPAGRHEFRHRRSNQSGMLAQLVSWLWRSLRLLPTIPGRCAVASPCGMTRRPGPDHGGAGRDVLPDARPRRPPTQETATR